MLRTCTTLDSLRSELLRQHDQKISRSGLYLRLIPRLGNSKEGRRHVQTGNLCLICCDLTCSLNFSKNIKIKIASNLFIS